MSENNSTEKLIERIVSDARADADKAFSDAEAKAREILQSGERDAAKILMEGEAQAQNAENDTLTKARTNAELDARKFDLKKRRELVERAYKAALDRLYALQGNALTDFITALLINEADGGETVCPAASQEEFVIKAVKAANAALEKSGKAALAVGASDKAVPSGFRLEGAGFCKLCSFEELISDLKEKEFSSVAGVLF